MTIGTVKVIGKTCTPDEIARARSHLYLPGETVRSINGGPIRTIAQTLVRPGDGKPDERELAATYVFADDDGEHQVGGYEDPWGHQHHYGTLTTRGGRLWLVPMDGDRIPEAPAIEILGIRGRFIAGDEDPAEAFRHVANEARLASEGEFVIHPIVEGGDYRQALLGGIPWWSQTDAETMALALAATVRAEGKREEPDPVE